MGNDEFIQEDGQGLMTVDDWRANPLPLLARWPDKPHQVAVVWVTYPGHLYAELLGYGKPEDCEIALASHRFSLRLNNGGESISAHSMNLLDPMSAWIKFPTVLIHDFHEEMAAGGRELALM